MLFAKRLIDRKVQTCVLDPINMVADALWKLSCQGPAKSCNTRHAAVVRLDAIGDFILWLDSGIELLAALKDCPTTLIANSTWASYAEKLANWDDVIAIDSRRFRTHLPYRLTTLTRLRHANFSVVVNPTYSRQFLLDDAVVRATKAPVRIGWETDGANAPRWQSRISDRWYTQLVRPDLQAAMEIRRNEEFVRKLFQPDFRAGIAKLPPSKFTTSPTIFPEQDYFVVAPSASRVEKRWPAQHYARVLSNIAARTGWIPVLVGDHSDEALCASVLELSGVPGRNVAGKTSLEQLAEVIRCSKILITNDSAAVHIAAAVATPSICIVGGGHYGRFLPYPADLGDRATLPQLVAKPMECFGCNWTCTNPRHTSEAYPCIADIEVHEVIARANVLLPSIMERA